jgi:hypothetical protein
MYVTLDCNIMKISIHYFPVENESGRHKAHSNQDLINSHSGNADPHLTFTNNNITIFKCFIIFI